MNCRGSAYSRILVPTVLYGYRIVNSMVGRVGVGRAIAGRPGGREGGSGDVAEIRSTS